MKLTHLALVLTLGLLGFTAYIAWNEHTSNTSARNKLELYERHGQPEPVIEAKEDQLVLEAMRKRTAGGATAPLPSPIPAPVASANVLPPASAPPTSISPPPPRIGTAQPAANLPHVSADSINAPPPPLTQQQRLVAAAPAIAKVSEYQPQYGFVVVTAGAARKLEKGMAFALRHDGFLVGRIKITEVEDDSAVGALDPKSIPDGVSIEKGDDVIQDVPSP